MVRRVLTLVAVPSVTEVFEIDLPNACPGGGRPKVTKISTPSTRARMGLAYSQCLYTSTDELMHVTAVTDLVTSHSITEGLDITTRIVQLRVVQPKRLSNDARAISSVFPATLCRPTVFVHLNHQSFS